MRKQEQRLWDRMRHCLKDKVYLERMENVVKPGRPDIDALWEGVCIPIELKSLQQYPQRATTAVLGGKGLNQNQLNWWLQWRRWGGRGLILIGIANDLLIVPAAYSDEVNTFTQSQLNEYQGQWLDVLNAIKQESQCVRNRWLISAPR